MVPLGATHICVNTEGWRLFNAFHALVWPVQQVLARSSDRDLICKQALKGIRALRYTYFVDNAV